MAATPVSGIGFGIGARYARVFKLDSTNRVAASSAALYTGVQVPGLRAYEAAFPSGRRIYSKGDDVVKAATTLPPLEGISGTVRSSGQDLALIGLADNTKVAAYGPMKMVGMNTCQQSNKPQVGLHLYQMYKTDQGYVNWRNVIIPSTVLYYKSGGMGENDTEFSWEFTPNVVYKALWGEAFTLALHGFLSTPYVEIISEYPLNFGAAIGDGTTTSFTFPVGSPAVEASADRIHVFVDGVALTTGLTYDTGGLGVTITAAPAEGAHIDIFWESAGTTC